MIHLRENMNQSPLAVPKMGRGPLGLGYQEYPVLYVDDEPQNLVTLQYVLGDEFTLLTAGSGEEAVELVERENIAVLMCDQRMPGMSGVEVCRKARELRPDTVRIMVTAHADLRAAVAAINEGQVARYVTKPWVNDELIEIVRTSIDLVRLQRTLWDMQVRILRQGEPTVIEALGREIARELEAPVQALEMNGDQVADLLRAGLSRWEDRERAEALVHAAREAQRTSDAPLTRLRALSDRLSRGQQLVPSTAMPAPCDIARVALASARMLSSTIEPCRIKVVLDDSPLARIDPRDLAQVLSHLVVNAAEALRENPGCDRTITLRVARRGPFADVAVLDHGPGMSREVADRAFDPHFTTKKGAKGLGLAVVSHLVGLADGTAHLEDTPEQGTTVVVRLPVVA
jgi:signal transduction histidine kinase